MYYCSRVGILVLIYLLIVNTSISQDASLALSDEYDRLTMLSGMETNPTEKIRYRAEAVAICQKMYGSEHKYCTKGKSILAQLYYNEEDYQNALLWSSYVANEMAIKNGKNSEEYVSSLDFQARCNKGIGNYQEALALFLEANEIYSVANKESQNYLISMLETMEMYRLKKNDESVLNYGLKIIEMFEQSSYDPSLTISYGAVLFDCAIAFMNKDDYSTALPMLIKSREIIEKKSGWQSREVIVILHNLLDCYLMLKEYQNALTIGLKTEEILKHLNQPNNPEYERLLTRLIEVYSALDNRAAAVSKEDELSVFCERTNVCKYFSQKEYNEKVEIQTAFSLLENGEYLKAKTVLLQIVETSENKNSESYCLALTLLSSALLNLNELEDALEYGNKALRLIKELVGENQIEYALQNYAIANIYNELNQFEKAQTSYEIGRKVMNDLPDEKNDPIHLRALNNYAQFLILHNRLEDASFIYFYEIFQGDMDLNEKNKDYGIYLSNYASLLIMREQYAEALSASIEAVEVLESIKETSGANYGHALNTLGMVYSETVEHEKALIQFEKALTVYQSAREEYEDTCEEILKSMEHTKSMIRK